jgi:hypothetical protein
LSIGTRGAAEVADGDADVHDSRTVRTLPSRTPSTLGWHRPRCEVRKGSSACTEGEGTSAREPTSVVGP